MSALIPFEPEEALRYFRADPQDEAARELVGKVYGELSPVVQPRYTARRFRCHTESRGGNPPNPDTVVLEGGTAFHSKALARYVGNSRELFLFGATLGSRVDSALRRFAVRSVTEAAAGQAVAAALIETYCNQACREIQERLPAGKKLKWRFSPGYGDWDLAEQRLLFRALDCAKTIGLTLTNSCMMAPVKSVTAVVAVADAAETLVDPETLEAQVAAEEAQESKCRRCGKTDCEFRRL
ncbi:MAG: AdoMet activation domain-containing protein [Succiniclasticum sp.]|jgi:hypothetical protein